MNVVLLVAAAFFAQSANSLIVSGDLPSPLTLTIADLAAMPHQSVTLDDPEGGKVQYEGVPLLEILKKAGLPYESHLRGKFLAGYLLASARDGYQVLFSLGELDPDFGNANIFVCAKRDGKPLFGYQGPLRLVIPSDKAGARSVRMLEKIEIVRLRK